MRKKRGGTRARAIITGNKNRVRKPKANKRAKPSSLTRIGPRELRAVLQVLELLVVLCGVDVVVSVELKVHDVRVRREPIGVPGVSFVDLLVLAVGQLLPLQTIVLNTPRANTQREREALLVHKQDLKCSCPRNQGWGTEGRGEGVYL